MLQEVFAVLVREVPEVRASTRRLIPSWLRQVTVNRVRSYRKHRYRQPFATGDQTDAFLERMVDSNSDLARWIDKEHDDHVCNALLSAVRSDFNQSTWDAFEQFAVEGRPAADVARDLGLTVNAVVKAKARVLERLREEGRGLLE